MTLEIFDRIKISWETISLIRTEKLCTLCTRDSSNRIIAWILYMKQIARSLITVRYISQFLSNIFYYKLTFNQSLVAERSWLLTCNVGLLNSLSSDVFFYWFWVAPCVLMLQQWVVGYSAFSQETWLNNKLPKTIE